MRWTHLAVVATLAAAAMVQGAVRTGAAQRRSPVDGTWDYSATPGLRGWSMFHDGHYIAFNIRADSTPAPGTLSDSARAKIYRNLALDAGTYTVTDTIVTCQRLLSKDPRQAPVTWRWSFVIKGDTILYHVLNAQGQSTYSGRSVRVRS